MEEKTKYCKYCAAQIPEDAVMCTHCGRQVEELKSSQSQPQIIVNNANSNSNSNMNINSNYNRGYARTVNKWVALILCIFFGWMGAHKFYEGKTGVGIIYLFTFGLFGIGWFIDFIILIFRPKYYYV